MIVQKALTKTNIQEKATQKIFLTFYFWNEYFYCHRND